MRVRAGLAIALVACVVAICPIRAGQAAVAFQTPAILLLSYDEDLKPGQIQAVDVTVAGAQWCQFWSVRPATGGVRAATVSSGVVTVRRNTATFAWRIPSRGHGGRWLLRVGCGATELATLTGNYVAAGDGAFVVSATAHRRRVAAHPAPEVRLALSEPIGAVGPCPAFGSVLIPGSSWLYGKGVDVRSNGGTGGDCFSVAAGHRWQCTELVNRLIRTLGWGPAIGGNAYQFYADADAGHFDRHLVGSGYLPVPGDIVVWSGGIPGPGAPHGYGHVAVVVADANGILTIAQQNASIDGFGVVPIDPRGTIGGGRLQPVGYLHARANTLLPPPAPSSPAATRRPSSPRTHVAPPRHRAHPPAVPTASPPRRPTPSPSVTPTPVSISSPPVPSSPPSVEPPSASPSPSAGSTEPSSPATSP